jgi:hypothetical protein
MTDTDNRNNTTEPPQNTGNNKVEEQEQLHVKNPFNKNDNKVITQEDVKSEQEFKEAQTERD